MPIKDKGTASEGLLGCALIAKLAARTSTGIRKVNAYDIQQVWEKLKKNRISKDGVKTFQEHVYDIWSTASDRLRITIRLGTITAKDLFNPKIFKEMSMAVNSACSYVNSKKVEDMALALFTDMVDDSIDVEVDGIKGRGSTTADIYIRNNSIDMSKISLKNATLKMGQVGGDDFSNFVRLFHGGPTKKGVYEPGLGLPINTPNIEKRFMELRGKDKTRESLQAASIFIYNEAARMISSAGDSTIIRNLQTFLKFFLTRNDDDIKIVVLEEIVSGRHKVLNPAKIEGAVGELKQLSAVYKPGMWPSILIYSGGMTPATRTKPNVIFTISAVYNSNTKKFCNFIEKGPMLDTLIEEKEDE